MINVMTQGVVYSVSEGKKIKKVRLLLAVIVEETKLVVRVTC